MLSAAALSASAQVVVTGVSPASVQMNFDYGVQANCGIWPGETDDGTWGVTSPDFNIPGNYIIAELAMVEDGTPGLNPQGNPISQEGCNTLTNDLTGKIAVVYRNTCSFVQKFTNAQNAGAVAVIVINREDALIGMLGTGGTGVTIPGVAVSSVTGQILTDAMAMGPVTMFIGNKLEAFTNDVRSSIATALIPKSSATPIALSLNGTENSFDLGLRLYNDGTAAKGDIYVSANIDGPGGNVYSETVGPISLAGAAGGVIDSIDIYPGETFAFTTFAPADYDLGKYTLTYDITHGTPDDFPSDNMITSNLFITEDLFAYGRVDEGTMMPIQNAGYRSSGATSTFSQCITLADPNLSRYSVEGIYFSASLAAAAPNPDLTGEQVDVYLYSWDDAFVDLNSATMNSINFVDYIDYYYPSDLQNETVYAAFSMPVTVSDNQRYLACVQTFNPDLYFGFDTRTDYTWNGETYLQPMMQVETDGTYYAIGFGHDIVPAMGVKLFPETTLTLTEDKLPAGSAYPNPATDKVIIKVEGGEGAAQLMITDVAGRTAFKGDVTLVNGRTEVNTNNLEAGVYVFNVTLSNGLTSTFNVVKK